MTFNGTTDEQFKADFEKKSIVELATLMEKYTGQYAQYEKSGIQTFIARTIREVIKERKMSDLYHFGDIPPTREEAMNSTWGE